MTRRDVERRLNDLEGDRDGCYSDVAEALDAGEGGVVYYSDGDGGVLGPEGEHIPESCVEVLEEYDGAAWINVQDDSDSSA